MRGALRMELYADAPAGGEAAARYQESLAERSADWLLEPAGPARLRRHTGRRVRGGQQRRPAGAHPAPGVEHGAVPDGDALPGDGGAAAAH
ncbi:hypothetical protein [Streptomyces sp. KL116D]|uniref:hypothetical protein n=1 Tax=Streptomyces sp. KL116D TaxID=3045152 RepID=UPI0035587F64